MKKVKSFLFTDGGPFFTLVPEYSWAVLGLGPSVFLIMAGFLDFFVDAHLAVAIATGLFTFCYEVFGPKAAALGLSKWGTVIWKPLHKPSRSTLQLAALGGEIGALGLPEFLIRHCPFCDLNMVPLFVDYFLPSPFLWLLTFVSVVGGGIGTALVGRLCTSAEVKWPISPVQSGENAWRKSRQLCGEVFFAWVRLAPLFWLVFWGVTKDVDFKLQIWLGLGTLAWSLMWYEACFEVSRSLFATISSAPPPRFLPAISVFSWALGAVLGWWLGGGYAALRSLDQHAMVLTPLQERLVLMSWSLESLIGACIVSSLMGWALGHWKNGRQVR